ncbi:2-amino-4-hydroxy-6-hydroxymethyldihydropteridine diphosphokinase [Sansalvadorimonas sp. 2012CJ34-2]|uniref:2-amino-4-hydroxy-6-hydroxymethyldihydropteridine diphosphokinase n=1 Tax=Parendozoicomonas callyspongiae TaxID=2942213 RepID=A0ABT0PF11_9GAMM|nr:2-amino-4-hydroxy-6-hydroxymethyldihydropteridine diphosphokinase [Sansalvadorimonas sp. 2012CJ34-2]
MKYRYVIGLGSNYEAEKKFPAMIGALLESFEEIWLSPVCKTTSTVGYGPDYFNAVASLTSALSPREFRKECKRIEYELGRVRPSVYCAADIDILACWDQPEPTYAQLFVEESYYQPQADSVLDQLGLCSKQVSDIPEGVQMALPDGRLIGLDTVHLQAA